MSLSGAAAGPREVVIIGASLAGLFAASTAMAAPRCCSPSLSSLRAGLPYVVCQSRIRGPVR